MWMLWKELLGVMLKNSEMWLAYFELGEGWHSWSVQNVTVEQA